MGEANKKNARSIQADTKFHLASCRKSYMAFAVAYAIYYGYIQSIDNEISLYLTTVQQKEFLEGITISCLVTHSHGLAYINGEDIRAFAPCTNWAYRGRNIELISALIKFATSERLLTLSMKKYSNPVIRILSFLSDVFYTQMIWFIK